MFGDLPSFASLDTLDDESRTRLANLLSGRNAYNAELIKLNELRIDMLLNPTPEKQEAIDAFNTTVVAPLRDGLTQDAFALFSVAVNIDNLKDLMPMVLAGVLQSVNIPLLLTVIGLEPDTINKLVQAISEFIKSGM
jgi:hypothetical protein